MLGGNGRRRRVSRSLEEYNLLLHLGCVPWHFRTRRHVVDPQPCALEHHVERQPAFADHFGQRLRIRPVGALSFGSNGAGRRIEGDKKSWIRIDQREPARDRLPGFGVWTSTRGVQDDNARLELQRGERATVVGKPDRLGGYVHIARDPRIDGNEIVFPFELESISADVDEYDGIRTGTRGLLDEIPKGVTQRILIEIARASHVKPRSLKSLGDQPRVVCGRVERSGLVAGISDDQRDALFRVCRARHGGKPKGEQPEQRGRDHARACHESSIKAGEDSRACWYYATKPLNLI